MHPQSPSEVQALVAACKQVSVHENAPGLQVLTVQNSRGSARLSLYGAQVLSYRAGSQDELLWLSPAAHYHQGRSIRGGIPLCWPWFGPHPSDASKSAHGFARHCVWQLDAIQEDSERTRLQLSLPPSVQSAQAWPQPFALNLEVSIGTTLQLALTSHNLGDTPTTLSAALHTYFAISDIEAIHISGLEDTCFRDAVNAHRISRQCGPIRFHGELDRVYHDTAATVVIEDPGHKRRIIIRKTGSDSTVVWNPWIDKSAALGDMLEGAYRQMVCVETANADHNRISLAPKESHCLYTEVEGEAYD